MRLVFETIFGSLFGSILDRPKTAQERPKIAQDRPKSLPRGNFFALKFRPRFGIDFGSMLAPKMPPFWHPFGGQNRSKNRSEIGLLKKSLQDRPKTAQDRPKMPPGPPRSSQDALPDPSGRPQKAADALPDPSGRSQMFFRSIWSKKSELVEKIRKKSRQRSSTVVTRIGRSQKPKALSQRSEPRGWRRWSREALLNPPPPAKHGTACCESH